MLVQRDREKLVIIGGASGVGKSSLSYSLARAYGIPLTEVDDLFEAIHALTNPEQQPLIHYWTQHPDQQDLTAAEIVEIHCEVCLAIQPAIAAVIKNHIETRLPMVLEGDYILPDLVAGFSGQIDAVFLIEDEKQIRQNFSHREPLSGLQGQRAEVSYLFGEYLRRECLRLGLSTIQARPWESLEERAFATFE